ncbi:acyl carrier protein phosphodiesterase [Schleiferia thermophila]|uniref:acyl carrier protein phosphodiesterase n=1 Tax=Schleiferia thermophila TaxID=884107 RepID=UPI002FDA12D4
MNFLGHLFHSIDNTEFRIGNLMADGLPASQLSGYPPMMQLGYRYHHWIDEYTDGHHGFKRSKALLSPHQGHYAAVVVDLAYDHFLALNWDVYSEIALDEYVRGFYNEYLEYKGELPAQFRTVMTYMIRYNWLQSYSTIEGLQKAFDGMSRRTKYSNRLSEAAAVIYEYKEELEKHFKDLLLDIVPDSRKWIKKHLG